MNQFLNTKIGHHVFGAKSQMTLLYHRMSQKLFIYSYPNVQFIIFMRGSGCGTVVGTADAFNARDMQFESHRSSTQHTSLASNFNIMVHSHRV